MEIVKRSADSSAVSKPTSTYPNPTSAKGKVPTGYAEEVALSEHTFRTQQRAFDNRDELERPAKKQKRDKNWDASDVFGYKGPWAKYQEEAPDDSGSEEEVEVTDEEADDEDIKQNEAKWKAGTDYTADMGDAEKSEWHGDTSSHDYFFGGRSWVQVDRTLGIAKEAPEKCYPPKKVINTFRSKSATDTKAITQMRFLPDTGHLLLTASADGMVRIYDVYHDRQMLRTYSGAKRSVLDVHFNYDGSKFLATSYDRSKSCKVYDTETGTCVARMHTGGTPHVGRWNDQNPSHFNELLLGCSDKKILQFDIRKPDDFVQEYDHHLGAINTLAFCDDGNRFLSTSDDRSLRAWEFGIPVNIKIISDPSMFALTRCAPHPSGKYILYQSGDNQIIPYVCTDKFRRHKTKSFRGHNTAGYAIDVACSPDGSLVYSGSSSGDLFCWDWKSQKQYAKLRCGDSPVVAVATHPRETSKVAAGDLNGVVKYFD